LLRVQTRGRRTYLVPARVSGAGPKIVAPAPTELRGFPTSSGLTVFHCYDPRLTWLEGKLFVVTALDTDQGGRLAIWQADGDRTLGFAGLDRLDFVALTGEEDTRNGVLFPERVEGRFLLLDRPNLAPLAGGPLTGDHIRLLESSDLVSWKSLGPVLAGRPRYWDELVGAGPPPVRTPEGWLLVYHGVATHFQSVNIYQAGAAVLDLSDPTLVRSRTRDNLLEPRESWELTGQVPNVVFPSGLTVDDGVPGGRALLYYGAADTVIGLAQASISELLAACEAWPAGAANRRNP